MKFLKLLRKRKLLSFMVVCTFMFTLAAVSTFASAHGVSVCTPGIVHEPKCPKSLLK
ncbi:MAG: AgrD family cyclic lactone autoinducer peptide [Ignavibacteriales bacterium]